MIKIRTKYDIKAYKDFAKYESLKVFILAYLCGMALLVVGIILAFTLKKGFLMYLLSAVLLPVSVHAYYKIKELEALKKPLLKNDTYQLFEFNEDYFDLEQISRGNNFKDKYFYNEIYSIVKYKKYYFIFINRVQAFIIKNEDYIFGDEEELDEIENEIIKEKILNYE